MPARYRLPRSILDQTFAHFRGCGLGRRECQVLWVSPWGAPETISKAVHPEHEAHVGGFVLADHWLNDFWFRLAEENLGVRIQVHTHPGEAFHSPTDDAFPIIHTTGFLSLVIPNFALGPIGFEGAFLTEIQADGRWREIAITERLVLT
jgi:hypothetical protein